MRREGAIQDLDEPAYRRPGELRGPNPVVISERGGRAAEVIADFIQSMDGETAYREGQAIKLGWGRVYQPHEALGEEQFAARGLFHPHGVARHRGGLPDPVAPVDRGLGSRPAGRPARSSARRRPGSTPRQSCGSGPGARPAVASTHEISTHETARMREADQDGR